MFDLPAIEALIRDHGLSIIAPVAVVEGPIVSIIAGHLAALGYFDFAVLTAVLVVADLVGDLAFYGLGRFGRNRLSRRLMARIGLPAAADALTSLFRRRGGGLLFFGKFTQGAGAAILFAAGAAHMPFAPFLVFNGCATVLKSIALVAIGAFFGHAYSQIGDWLGALGLATLGLIVIFGAVWLWKTKSR
jgi:membrane protein DedA with SNARE-associated domain